MTTDPSELVGKRLASYVRVSSDKQDATRQRESIKRWSNRFGLTIDMTFEDSQGRNPRDKADKRIDFQRLLRFAETGSIDAIIVDSQDRFGAANAHQFGKFLFELSEHNVELWSVSQGCLSRTDPATIFMTTAGSVASTAEQEKTAERNLGQKIIAAKNGEYQGGYPPFGFDVVCFDGEKEKWRVFYDGGHHKRVKISPTGTRQRFDGKGNFPAKDAADILRIRPSVDKQRCRVAKRIFEWYATESISPRQIATRLNDMGIKPVFSEAWHKVIIREILGNPVYVGLPSYNKRSSGRFYQFSNGQMSRLEQKTRGGRRHDPADYVQPSKAEFTPVVSQEIFCTVQRKLKESSDKHRKPKVNPPTSDHFWLKGFVYCFKCGKPMRVWNTTANGNKPSYFCGTYGTYGAKNPSGCRCHRVHAELVETIVERYLDEVGMRAELLAKGKDEPLTKEMFAAVINKHAEFNQVWQDMNSFILDNLDDGENEFQVYAATKHENGDVEDEAPIIVHKSDDEFEIDDESFSEFDLYEYLHKTRQAELNSAIEAKEREFDDVFESYRDLTSQKAKRRANAAMEQMESEISKLQRQLEPLSKKVLDSWKEFDRMSTAAKNAKKCLKESNNRRKHEAMKSVLERVVCHFRYSDVPAANQPKSILDKVEILPVFGDPMTYYQDGPKPVRG